MKGSGFENQLDPAGREKYYKNMNRAKDWFKQTGILYKYENDPFSGFTADSFKSTLNETLKGRAEEVWIFGSFARNEIGRDSDIDLLIVADTDRPFIERPRDFEDLYNLGPVVDLLVYTPDEFIKLRQDPPLGFWRSVISEMVRIL